MQENNIKTDSMSATDNSSQILDFIAEDQRSVDFETLEPGDSSDLHAFAIPKVNSFAFHYSST